MEKINGEQAAGEQDAWELLAKYFRHPKVLLTTLTLFTAVLYSGTLFFQFVWDDGPQIVDNPMIRSWHSLSRVFVSDLWYHAARQQIYYRPLFVAWSIINYALVGLRPWGWHLGAILLHLGATLAVYWLARRLGLEYWTAALATLIFAFHPIHIECVAWISAASDSMVTMFAALAFAAFLNAREPNRAHRLMWHLASLVLLACALLTKEMAISFTALVGVYVWLCPSEETHWAAKLRRTLVAMLPYAAVTLCYVVLRRLVLWHSPFQFDMQHSYGDMALTLPYVVAFYLKQLVLPLGLTGLYYTPYVTTQIVSQVVLPVVILSALAALLYFWARKSGDWVVAFASCWLLIGLAPALYLRNFGNGDFVRDRYIYLPSIGFCILIAKALRLLPPLKAWAATAVQGAAVGALCVGYIAASLSQQAYWDSDLLINLRGHELYPDSSYASIGLGRQYSFRGAHDKAIALTEDAMKKDPTSTYTAFALAEVYIAAGRKAEGRKALDYALRNAPPGYIASETSMASIAALWGKLGDYDQAKELCGRVLGADSNLLSALFNCGNIELMAGHYSEAEPLLRHAAMVAPQLSGPRHFLGRALLLEGRNAEAQPYLEQAVTMDPSVYDYHYWLGISLEKSGDTNAAREEYRRALQLNEDSSEAKLHMAALESK